MTLLDSAFFARDTLMVARNLLGCMLVHIEDDQRVAGRIVEVEAYTGWDDKASHGHRGPTPRNAVMFGPAGVSYIYLCYGIHWMLNIVAKPPDVDYPAAILLRALEPVEGLDRMAQRRSGRTQRDWANGPGRLTLTMGIDHRHNGANMSATGSDLFIESGKTIPAEQIAQGARIGINVPEPSRSQPWRYWIKDSLYVSKGR